jgi:short-subunit dehydrogenase
MADWVLITGASQGIGHAFTRLFAQDGHPLVLVARDGARLEQIAVELRSRHGIEVRVLAKDLSVPSAPREIFEELQRAQLVVGTLVNNAGIGVQGPFAELELSRQLELLQVNVTALVQLTHLFLPPMLVRRDGRIVNVASTASFMPGPFLAMYYASKAFVHSFSQALAAELAGSGVTMTAVYPGLTRSEFHRRAGMERPDNRVIMMEAEAVARIGYGGMKRGRRRVVTGWVNRLVVVAARLLPARLMMWLVVRTNRAPSKPDRHLACSK